MRIIIIIGVELIYKVVLVSGVQQSDSHIYIYVCITDSLCCETAETNTTLYINYVLTTINFKKSVYF